MNFANQARRTLFAVALIVAGAILFLDNIGVLPVRNIGAYWPVAFVVYGIGLALCRTTATAFIWAGTLVAFGLFLTLGNLGIVHATISVAWPLLLIAIGATALVRRTWRPNKMPGGHDAWQPGQWGQWKWQDDIYATKRQFRQWKREHRRHWRHYKWDPNAMHETAVFFSLTRRFDGKEVKDGELTAVFGSLEADFTGAIIPLVTPENGGAPVRRVEIEATAVFGSVEIRVPSNWRVIKEGAGVFGTYEDRTLPFRPEPGVEPPTLIIRGAAVFGSVEIEN